MKTIETLIRVSKFELDEKRRVLSGHLDEEDALLEKRRKLDEELVREQETAKAFPDMAITYGSFANQIIARRDKLDGQIVVKRRETELAREEVQIAFEEVKKYEITLERMKAEEAKERAKVEQEELDEMGLNAFRRADASKRNQVG